MDRIAIILLVGLLAGAAGGLIVEIVDRFGGTEETAEADWAALDARLQRIEADLQAMRRTPATLATREPAPVEVTGLAALPAEERAMERLLERIDDRVGKTLDEKWKELKAEGGMPLVEEKVEEPGKRRMPLADAARELDLSASEEDELRRIFEDSQQKMFEILAKPDGDPEEVRREVMAAADDPEGGQMVIAKYLPKFLTNIGDIMAVQMERRSAIRSAIGPEKAAKLEDDYSITEDDILNMDGGVRVEARAESR